MKFYLSKEANENKETLFYYPYTFGSHLDKATRDTQNIRNELSQLPISKGFSTIRIPNIGTIKYKTLGDANMIESITWNAALRRFYYTRANFITFTTHGGMPSVHPALYKDRNEDFFKCDNGFKVVSRKAGGKEWFNFKNLSGGIVSDIDFTQVLPFSKDRGMTARGYKPDRTCWAIYPTGRRIMTNESKDKSMNGTATRQTESELKAVVRESVKKYLNERSTGCNSSERLIAESEAKKETKKRPSDKKDGKVGINGYRIEKDGCDYVYDGEKCHSVISVVNRYGNQKYHIDTDDHCYVFFVEMDGKTREYEFPYIFDELLDAIKMLPRPS